MGHHRRLGLSPGALSPNKAVCALIVAQKQEPLEPEEVRELDTKDFRTTGRDQHPGPLWCAVQILQGSPSNYGRINFLWPSVIVAQTQLEIDLKIKLKGFLFFNTRVHSKIFTCYVCLKIFIKVWLLHLPQQPKSYPRVFQCIKRPNFKANDLSLRRFVVWWRFFVCSVKLLLTTYPPLGYYCILWVHQ